MPLKLEINLLLLGIEILQQKEIPQTIPKDPVVGLQDTHSEKTNSKKLEKLSLPSLSSAPAKKPATTFCHCRLPQLTLYHCESIPYLQTFNLTHPSIGKSRFKTQPRNVVIAEKF